MDKIKRWHKAVVTTEMLRLEIQLEKNRREILILARHEVLNLLHVCLFIYILIA